MITRAGVGLEVQTKPESANNRSRPRKASAARGSMPALGHPSIAVAPAMVASWTADRNSRSVNPLPRKSERTTKHGTSQTVPCSSDG